MEWESGASLLLFSLSQTLNLFHLTEVSSQAQCGYMVKPGIGASVLSTKYDI